MSVDQKTALRKWIGNAQTGRKYLWNNLWRSTTKDLLSKNINNSYNSITKGQTIL